MLRADRRVDRERGGGSLARGEVMICGIVRRKIGRVLRIDMDGVPDDGARGFLGIERQIAGTEGGIDGVSVRIPFRDKALDKGDVDRDGSFALGIEIEDGSFHADGTAQAAFELNVAEMFDERGEIS